MAEPEQRTGLATVAEAAEFLRLSKQGVYGLIYAGKLRHAKMPGTGSRFTHRIPWPVLYEFVESSMTTGAGE
jgi:excisionase family DNA binding protein